MKAFYVERWEDPVTKKGIYSVWDYYLKRPLCLLILDKDSTNELYADRIAKALNEMMHPEGKK